ncbi:hypothetical protein ASF29_23270 [Rhizobium sp. Leaf262]|nr:hypothetical protein ASF29_23270 [Rhizobium sp. Leaf262]
MQDKYKLKDYQAAGVVGNLMQESTFNTGARNAGDGRDGSDSVGIGQWNSDRARNMRAYTGDSSSLDRQLDFVMHEMQGSGNNGGGSEAYAWNQLMNSKDVHGATAAIISYERPAGWSKQNPTAGHGFDNRLSWAGEVMGMSPDQIASARPSAASQAQAQAVASAGTTPDETAVAKPPEKKLFEKLGLPSIPEKIGGFDTAKGFKAMGDIGKLMTEHAEAQNKQVQAAAQMGQNRRANAGPVEVQQIDTALFGNAINAANAPTAALSVTPQISEEMKKKLLMARRGGLGGLGGFGRA